ncbi:TPA: ATP-binding cassette domain-containing protein [Candidatus Geothermarchaeota archaeon]|nr:ATP-binding cassette domain-containing protein [Candidatus Geothermarchaeota archaeon]
MIITRNLKKTFQTKKMAVHSINKVSFEAREGELTVLTGPSGGGKTVVLNMLAGFIKPDYGDIIIYGEYTSGWGWSRWNSFRRRYISYGTQRNIFIPNISVEDNISLPLLMLGHEKSEVMDLVRDLMERLGIEYLYGRKTYTLSGGEQRRVMVARTLINDTPIILLDEPTAELDEDSSKLVIDLINDFISRDKIFIVATHDKNLVNIGDRVIKIDRGYSTIIK